MTDPRYPIGKFTFDGPASETQRTKFIDDIEQAPAALRNRRQKPDSRTNRNSLS